MQEQSNIYTESDDQRSSARTLERLPDFTTTEVSPPVHTTVTQWLSHGMSVTPDAPAIRFEKSGLTHGELDALGNRIADALTRSGVQPGDRVGLCLNRSIEMVAAVIGILRSGAAYVPLDPDYPAERLAMMQEDASLRMLLVHAVYADQFNASLSPVTVWEDFEKEVECASSVSSAVNDDPERAAYVIFTSGSTGRPKGISMPHRALANLIEWQLERKTFKTAANVLQYSSISFDVSFQEIATTLSSGGTLHLISNDERKDPRTLLDQLVEHRIDRLFLPYVAMRSMIEAAHVVGSYPVHLKEVITAGEQLRIEDSVRRFFGEIPDATLDNQYGPSETHVITAHLLEGDPAKWPDLPPIGTPLKNCSAYILNEDMDPVVVGDAGELYLGGRNLAHGYINRDDMTSKAFLPSPFDISGHPRLYRTGDLAAYNPDGSINFLGRRDQQIKIRGHRIEPGEINNSASAYAGVGHCLTHAAPRSDGVLQLVTYFTVKDGAKVDTGALRRYLESKLPDYMVPAFIIEIDEIPYTPSGKVDLKALPKPTIDNSQYAEEERGYATEAERLLAGLWSELLGLERIPRSADFFELGGDSLRAVTLFLQIQQRFGKELPLSTLAHTSTISGLAQLLAGDFDLPGLSGYRSLQLLQQGQEGETPLFLVHGGKGNVLVFNSFAHSLDPRQPVYAFQWAGWDGGPGERSIREMAQAYALEIQQFLQGRACRLGGNCIGGLIAIEVARLLSREGIGIDGPLLIWDSPNIHSSHYHPKEPWGRESQMATVERIKEELLQLTPGHGRRQIVVEPEPCSGGFIGVLQRTPYLRRLVQWSKAQFKNMPVYRAKLTGQQVPLDLREHYCIRTMLSAVRKHVTSPYTGDILYFRSHSILGRDFGIPGWWDDLYFGFHELCGGRFEAHIVGGRHDVVMDMPGIAEIVNQIYYQQSETNKDES